MDDKITTAFILAELTKRVEGKIPIPKEEWLEVAFKLNLLELEERKFYNKMSRALAQKMMDIYQKQEKRNVSAARLEKEASEEYQFLQDQKAKLDAITEFIRIAKKNADEAW